MKAREDTMEMDKFREQKSTRRSFLTASAGAGGLLALHAAGVDFPATMQAAAVEPASVDPREIFQNQFPKGLVFRQSEILARQMGSYQNWEQKMLPMDGINGKVFQEEVFLNQTKNINWFTQYKSDHPEKLVMVHFSGYGRVPTFERSQFFPGHWLYRAGSELTQDADSGTTTLHVADASLFRLGIGTDGDRGDDMTVCLLNPDGTPNWDKNTSEHLKLVSKNDNANTLTVERGAYGTAPNAFPVGSYIAAIETLGPFGPQQNPQGGIRNLIWAYNYSATCPKDPQGRNCVNALVDDIVARFSPGGVVASLDGIQFDIWRFFAVHPGAVDANTDGVPDGGVFNGVNWYGLGMVGFLNKLRMALPDKIIMTDDKFKPKARPTYLKINGYEAEGWPDRLDFQVDRWSEGVNGLAFAAHHARAPRLSYINYKYKQNDELIYPINYASARLNLAATALTDTAFAPFQSPGEDPDYRILDALPDNSGTRVYQFDYFDELVKGTANVPKWLGAPVHATEEVSELHPDLLGGKGVTWPQTFIDNRFVGAGPDGQGLVFERKTSPSVHLAISSTDPGTGPELDRRMRFILKNVTVPNQNMFVALRFRADSLVDYPASILRELNVAVGDGTQLLAGPYAANAWQDPFKAIFLFRTVGPGTVNINFAMEGKTPIQFEKLTVHSAPGAAFREFENGVVFANPSQNSWTFQNLQNKFPGATLRRLQGSADQDPNTNNGTVLGDTLTLGPRDALFVAKQ